MKILLKFDEILTKFCFCPHPPDARCSAPRKSVLRSAPTAGKALAGSAAWPPLRLVARSTLGYSGSQRTVVRSIAN